MAQGRGFFRRKGTRGIGEIAPIRVGDVLPAAPEENAKEVAHRVRAIFDAAERNAAEIERFAHADAERIRAEAVAEGEAHIARVRESTVEIERRAAAMESAIAEIVSGLGRGAAQLDAELAGVSHGAVSANAELAAAPSEVDPEPGPESESESEPEPEPESEPEPNAALQSEPDLDGARLVALNLALEGLSSDAAIAELADHYPGMNLEGIVDEVFSEFGATETPVDSER